MIADHILRNTQATVEITFTVGDATGAVTYSVTDEAGVSVATGTATNEAEDGRYTFVLPPQPAVAVLTVVWTGTWGAVSQLIETFVEIVGGHLFTVAEARAFDSGALANSSTYPDATIREARAGISEFFEEVTGVSFVPRYHRETLDAPGSPDLWLGKRQVRALLSGSVDGTALTVDEIADVAVYEYGKLYRSTGSWPAAYWSSSSRQSVVVAYEHGYQSVPFEIHRAALILCRYWLIPTDVTDRAISFTNDVGGFVRLSVPTGKYPTGIPTVDAALSRYTPSLVLA